MRSRPTPWTTVLLLCGKCGRKMDGGYGPKGKETLRTALRAELKAGGHGRAVRIIETRCLGVCPKKAVTALNASRPARLLVVPNRTPAAEALADLLRAGDGEGPDPERGEGDTGKKDGGR
ncbi:MAG: hypothetical protein BGO51_17450 [Rhodospirillales bacterium 69-11]|nr:MAG: hypothetical protein BGO51_17450 [Rhodospirillales bacterium 69-11]